MRASRMWAFTAFGIASSVLHAVIYLVLLVAIFVLFLGAEVPWFDTTSTVRTAEHGDELATCLGGGAGVLLRGFRAVTGLSSEVRERLSNVRPSTLGQASRMPGITPAAIGLLAVHIRGGRAQALGFSEMK